MVTLEQAQMVIGKFKEAFAKTVSPRMLIFVNCELGDYSTGLKLSVRTEHSETTRTTGDGAKVTQAQKATNKNNCRIRERKEGSLPDKQTARMFIISMCGKSAKRPLCRSWKI